LSKKETPLLIAVRRGHKEVVSMLLEAGADMEAVDKVRSSSVRTIISGFSVLFATVLL
jgi:ankyrin repeat protein